MDEMADIEDLPKRVQYRQYREEGYGVREAADMAGYSGPPPPEARALDDTDIQVATCGPGRPVATWALVPTVWQVVRLRVASRVTGVSASSSRQPPAGPRYGPHATVAQYAHQQVEHISAMTLH